jgi:hypothetical protein
MSRISSLKQFVALKTLYIDFSCLWNMDAAIDWHSPQPTSPISLFTTLLPESIEQFHILFQVSYAWQLGFSFEDHLKGLAVMRREYGVFPHLKRVCVRGVFPIDHRLHDHDEYRRRMSILAESEARLGNCGVEVIYDGIAKSDSKFEFMMSHL